MPNDFYIYTFIFDVSGISKVTLYIRQDHAIFSLFFLILTFNKGWYKSN